MEGIGSEQQQMPPLQQPQPFKPPDQHLHLHSPHTHSHGHRSHGKHHHSHGHRDKDGSSRVKVSGHRSTRYKEKFQVLRERYDRVIAIHEAHQRNLDLAASKLKKLQEENDLLLDSIYASSPQLMSLISPVLTLNQPFQPGRQHQPPPLPVHQQQPPAQGPPSHYHQHHPPSQHATPLVSPNTIDRRSSNSSNNHVYNNENESVGGGQSHGRGHLREASTSSVQTVVPNGHAANGVAAGGGQRGSEDRIRVPSP